MKEATVLKEDSLIVVEVENEAAVSAGRAVNFPIPESTTMAALTPHQAELARKGHIKTMTIFGDSLKDIGIYDMDRVVVQKVFSKKEIDHKTVCIIYLPEHGETVAKIPRFLGKEILLKSCNRQVPDMYVPSESVDIRAIIIGLCRPPDKLGRFDRGYDEGIPL